MQTYIITHPLRENYGGILQGIALRHVAHRIRPTSIAQYDIVKQKPIPLRLRLKQRVKAAVMRMRPSHFSQYPNHLSLKIGQHAIRTYLNTTSHYRPLPTSNGNSCFIVGSDQVWRAIYARSIKSVPFFFLDFATPQERARSIAYAASFGSDTWEGTPEETEQCAQLLREFKAVSVREHSGVRLCKEVFGVEAVQMPDPTLLPQQNFYNELIRKTRTRKPEMPYIANYVLDSTPTIQALLGKLAQDAQLYMQPLMPRMDAPHVRDRFPINVAQWLRYIRDARYLVTDSFHGCVFAIIFNIPFICLGNKRRGTARFDTLLQTYGLQQRLLHADSERDCFMNVLSSPIDWQHVNAIHEAERQRGLDFLKQNLQ